MTLTRRHLLVAAPATLAAGLVTTCLAVPRAHAQTAAPKDPRLADRALGPADAKTVVQEWFSLTCTHCARFSREVFPEVQAKLIDTGRIRYVFKDFPLDQTALMAAMVARALPPERYVPFVEVLFQNQDRWAFGQDVDPKAELARMAALAGMAQSTFDATIVDNGLKAAILAEQEVGETQFKVDSTPTFVFDGTPRPGEMTFDAFSGLVKKA